MKYPSLLFTGKQRRGDIAPSVFEDLKLDLLLPKDALKVMSGICPQSDIPPRSELFAAMDDEALHSRIGELYNIINAAKQLDEAIKEVGGERSRDILFVRLSLRLTSFCKKAAELERSEFFLSRLSEHFKALISGQSFSEFAKETEELCEKCAAVADFSLTVQDELYGPTEKAAQTVIARLRAAASALEIGPEELSPFEYRACDEFTEALLEKHGELCSLASQFRKKYKDHADTALLGYADELGFIIAIHSLIKRIREAGLPLAGATLSNQSELRLCNAYDVTLLEKGEKNIIPNDAALAKEENFFFLGGANGGGKTTFLRTVGVNVLLAMSGAPAAATSLTLGLCDGIFTHFPHDEHFEGEGRFDNEKRRVNEMLSSLGNHPLVLLNETYSTTNEEKSIVNTSALAEELYRRGVYGIYVTHAHGAKAEGVKRLIVAVDENDSNRRTYKVVRALEANNSFAEDILKKYELSAEQLEKRFPAKEATV